MPDYDDFMESIKTTISGVADIAKNIVSSAGDKAKAFSRIAKLTLDINSEKEGIKKVYAEIGRLYYETNRENPGDFFVQLFAEVTLANEHIAGMEAELSDLKSTMGDTAVDHSDSFDETVTADECCAGGDCCCCSGTTEASIEVEITDETPKE